ncbi:hypothetical protein HPB47_000472 [Ixodes persulcatus]|uniref:Uncharacterized protein n=1 Tax=Ixodes persulcatus TaxID=34615 RepID=A0AC60PRV1_IXOPE|nr:hypothetical protein HPB47_000472 [Ixodes persulcatus]
MKAVFTLPEKTHGPGPVFFTWQKAGGNYLVTTGYDQNVNVYDRHGNRKDQITLPGMCTGLGWEKDGDVLGIITDKSPILILWDANNRNVSQVDTGLRDVLTLLLWAKTGPFVAIGTSKGNLLVYNHRSCRKVPILGKHTKRITYGAWSQQNMLALVGEDNVLTVSNQEGDTLCQTSLKSEATLVQFSCMKRDEKNPVENTVSLVLNKKTLLLLDIYDPENPIEWLDWSDDGQLLGASGAGGSLHVFLTKLPSLGNSLGHRYAYLTSLYEVTVASVTEPELQMTVKVDIEPGFIALGPFHLVVGMNNRAWFYALGDKSMLPLQDKEYLGTVKSMKLNGDYAAALFDGKIQMQLIETEQSDMEERESKLFPDSSQGQAKITCHSVTEEFLMYGTDAGTIEFFFLEDWTIVNRYRHTNGIRQIHPDSSGGERQDHYSPAASDTF